MNVLIVVNALNLTKMHFDKAVNHIHALADENTEVTIVDLMTNSSPVKYASWLRWKKQDGPIKIAEVIDYKDYYKQVLIIGNHFDLPDYTNCSRIVRYKSTISQDLRKREEDAVWS